MSTRYWHGGASGLRPGDVISPRGSNDLDHLVDGCTVCEARRAGQQLANDDNNPAWVYVTTHREYARIYAAGYPRGALYVVDPLGEMHDRTGEHDPVPSWGVERARVLSVYDAVVIPSRGQMRRWLRAVEGGGPTP